MCLPSLLLLISLSHCFFLFFFNDTATTEIYTLSLHDALPISTAVFGVKGGNGVILITTKRGKLGTAKIDLNLSSTVKTDRKSTRLNSSHSQISYAVFCLKKKKKKKKKQNIQKKNKIKKKNTTK